MQAGLKVFPKRSRSHGAGMSFLVSLENERCARPTHASAAHLSGTVASCLFSNLCCAVCSQSGPACCFECSLTWQTHAVSAKPRARGSPSGWHRRDGPSPGVTSLIAGAMCFLLANGLLASSSSIQKAYLLSIQQAVPVD